MVQKETQAYTEAAAVRGLIGIADIHSWKWKGMPQLKCVVVVVVVVVVVQWCGNGLAQAPSTVARIYCEVCLKPAQ
jgi:hypothetical protein